MALHHSSGASRTAQARIWTELTRTCVAGGEGKMYGPPARVTLFPENGIRIRRSTPEGLSSKGFSLRQRLQEGRRSRPRHPRRNHYVLHAEVLGLRTFDGS